MSARVPAEVFPPGDFLREELEAREWSQQELADILDRPPRLISELIAGKRAVTPETAKGLAEAFGTSAEYWMSLESKYQLSKVKTEHSSVARKANLYSKFPVREMLRRGWIQASENLDVLEERFCEFFNIPTLDHNPSLTHYAKKTDVALDVTPLQLAWLFRARLMADRQILKPYSKEKLVSAVAALQSFLLSAEEVRHVPRVLAEAGVRLVFIEAISGSKIDGACFWLAEDKPVIGMSLRFDRIDNFWFVLRHEIEHVLREDGKNSDIPILDLDLGSESNELEESERLANEAAQEFCVPSKQLQDFISRVQPYFSEQKVTLFAQRIKVHPGIVIGQLQRKLGRHDFLRKHQVKIRNLILPSADTDGWGMLSS
ncbi:HigA family addiction module antitoxin [Pseudomonas cichorii]|uniref:HigA family addiction module antitoxin n=1 Tax=Pseudomonas cichorii TaxID=36746 RepID=UPI001C893F75|nr:HigA family addiction module antitoxin [Pseudomonas cichorii]MBX8497647.1 HigA family addiction module antidote protein [Pseudomonas cichorii]